MKAIILAGGKGTRGRPYTDYFPKAMIPINGTPMIQYIAKYLGAYPFIEQIIIISDFAGMGGQIQNHLDGQEISKKIKFVQDSQRGTGGDLLDAEKLLKDTDSFVLWFADNFCAVNLEAMKKQFERQDVMACIATRRTRREETGFAKIKNGYVTEFEEKPTIRLRQSECLGIYMLDTNILRRIKQKSKKEINLSYDILAGLAKKQAVGAYDIGDREWLDVESPVVIDRNQEHVDKIIKQMGF